MKIKAEHITGAKCEHTVDDEVWNALDRAKQIEYMADVATELCLDPLNTEVWEEGEQDV